MTTMFDHHLDFRSDTAAWPSAEMRAAMAEAAGRRRRVRRRPDRDPPAKSAWPRCSARRRSMYVPSGTMSNLIGVRLHCRPGDEMICEADCHLYHYEQAGYAQLSGLAVRTVPGEHGVMRLGADRGPDPPRRRPFRPHAARLAREHPQPRRRKDAALRDGRGDLRLGTRARAEDAPRRRPAVQRRGGHGHRGAPLDAAFRHGRASASARGSGRRSARRWPGRRADIDEARRHRKVLGGGMRQAGVIAAAAL